MKSTWFSISLGDAMLADDSLQQIKKQFTAQYEQAGSPEQVALFMRHESEGRLHCEVKLYFSPATEAIARQVEAAPCPTPSNHGLSLIAGSDKGLFLTISPHEPSTHQLETEVNQDDVDITAWRKAKREALIATRLAVPLAERKHVAGEVAEVLDELIDFNSKPIVSLYWPFRGELNLLDWMQTAHERGARIALPMVVAKAQPLAFREWSPDCKMERGVWNIPIPADATTITPTIVISPLVGYDPDCFRLGYGGGFFDWTLAALSPRPYVIGVGHPCTAIPTIHPQPHDIPMDVIITGKNSVRERAS